MRWAASESPPEPSEIRWDMLSEQLDVVPEIDCAAAERCQYQIEDFDGTMNYLVQVRVTQGLDDADGAVGAWELVRNSLGELTSTPTLEPTPTSPPAPPPEV